MKPLKTVKIYPKEKKHKYFSKWYNFIQEKKMTNKECNLEVYKNGILVGTIYKPTIKKALEDKKEMKKNILDDEKLTTKFKIKKI
tara:strand:- start:243 stop:497 length:255 start_codon:yes stop_codon:yes gene_type:complete